MLEFDDTQDCGLDLELLLNNRSGSSRENNNEPQRFPFGALAMSYVPYQEFENLYSYSEALNRGTLYKDLDLPFLGGKAVKRK